MSSCMMQHKHNCICGFSAEFSIWTREAGAGGLSIAVEGPSKAEITFEDRKDGSCGVAYVVQEPGEMRLTDLRSDFAFPATVLCNNRKVCKVLKGSNVDVLLFIFMTENNIRHVSR